MKKLSTLSICLFFAFFFSSCIQSIPSMNSSSDETVMLHWLDMDPEGFVRKTMNEGNATRGDSLFTGKAIETFEQSPTKSVSSWKRGERHGITTEYFYNGRKRRVISYENGKRNGISKEFRITGELLAEETYSDNKLDGLKSEWHPNGTKTMEVQMRDGIPHGNATEWYVDGTKKSLTIYRHGLREGPSTEWYRNGQQKLGLFYQKDKQHGLRTIWYDNGKKRLTAQFVDDKMEGNSKGWFPNGQQQFDYNFRNNLEHGVCVEWNETGQKVSELQFIDGQPIQDLLSGKSLQPIQEPESVPQEVNPPVPANTKEIPPSAVNISDAPAQSNPIIETNSTVEVKDPDLTPTVPTPEKPKTTNITNMPAVLSDNNETKPAEPTFDPFNLTAEPIPPTETAEPIVDKKIVPPVPPPPPPPAPTFDPFASESGNSNESKPSTGQPDSIPLSPPPPPPTFNPFEDKPLEQTEKPSELSTKNVNSVTPAPTFNPFEKEPAVTSPESPSGQGASILDLPPPPPPPPAPTFNPFENDPLPPPPTDIAPQASDTKNGNNPFDSVKDDSNESSVPLENIFNSPPTAPPADTFNPFDLPSEN